MRDVFELLQGIRIHPIKKSGQSRLRSQIVLIKQSCKYRIRSQLIGTIIFIVGCNNLINHLHQICTVSVPAGTPGRVIGLKVLVDDRFKLLRCYRNSSYSLKVAVRQVEIQFQLEYKTSVDEFLDSIYAAGADLGDSQIEEWAKSVSRSNKMLKLLLSSVDLLRKNHKQGAQYYWILYYAFLSPQEPQNTDEIQGKYAGTVEDIHKGTVFVRLELDVNAIAHSCYDNRTVGKKDIVSFVVTHIDEARNVAVGIITRIIKQNL